MESKLCSLKVHSGSGGASDLPLAFSLYSPLLSDIFKSCSDSIENDTFAIILPDASSSTVLEDLYAIISQGNVTKFRTKDAIQSNGQVRNEFINELVALGQLVGIKMDQKSFVYKHNYELVQDESDELPINRIVDVDSLQNKLPLITSSYSLITDDDEISYQTLNSSKITADFVNRKERNKAAISVAAFAKWPLIVPNICSSVVHDVDEKITDWATAPESNNLCESSTFVVPTAEWCSKLHQCRFCRFESDFKTMSSHVQKIHSNCKCPVCGLALKGTDNLKIHRKSHTGYKVDAGQRRQIVASENVRAGTKIKNQFFDCQQCSYSVERFKLYKAHMKEVHDIKVSKKKIEG